ncbi:EamA-like transporter family protein [Bacillus mangrovi]|uniref:EamA-like transporter family protein n=1 Tax=Metabacillus mangrovi TaxID=1491830 RepID=A0A7X2V6Q3_9BACI|nr:DMT family transporter [Metabacillus mangrovi]MTH55288.1 EamA-like transporter family protein [Metabacillus mangrovi]
MSVAMILLAFAGGYILSAQSSINGKMSPRMGTLETSLLTFFTGALFLSVWLLFFGQGNLLGISEAPKWQLTGVFFGIGYLFLTIMTVPKIGVAVTNIIAIIGQIGAGFIIDQFGLFGADSISFSWSKGIGLVFMLVALMFIMKDEWSFENKMEAGKQ